MAALTSIRSKGKLIAICVGGALLAFVLGDFINSGATIFGASQAKMAEINGNSIDYNDFMAKVNERETFVKLSSGRGTIDSETSEQIREYCWEQEVNQNTIGAFANKQGLMVTDEEVKNLIHTGNVTPTIANAFANPQTGMYDPSFVLEFMKNTNEQGVYVWNMLEKELRETRLYVKYINMITEGLYATTADVEKEFAQRTQMSDIKYVAIPFSDIKDEEVKVADADLNTLYNQNKMRYDRSQETRDIAYVSFDVIPSQKDSAEALKIAEELNAGLAAADEKDVQNFINGKSDVPFYNYHYGKGDIRNDKVDSLMFVEQPGFVYGPYVEGDYYKSARLINKTMRADSVEVSHILIMAQSSADTLAAKAKADSLLGVYNSGIDFGALAMQFSQDGSAADSGKLGWVVEGTNYVPEFKEACFATEKGKTTIVKSQYGYHIIKVTNKTAPKQKVTVGFLLVEIRPSNQTRQEAYAKASEFAGVNRKPADFEKAISEQGLIRRVAPNLYASTRNISGIENSRELVRWAFDPEKSKEVSEIKEFGDRYIVAALAAVHPKGIAPLSEVKEDIMIEALNSAKGDAIVSKLGSPSSVDAAAQQMGKNVQEAHNVNFEMTQIPGMGFEPAVLAVATSLGQNQVSAPVKGRNAVYVIQNTAFTPAQAIQPINVTTDKKQLMLEYRNRCSYQITPAIQKLANIDDRRVKFF